MISKLKTFSHYINTAKEISKRYNKSYFPILIDILASYSKYDANDEDYLIFDFYNIKSPEYRNSFITSLRGAKFAKLLNDPQICKLYENKARWDKVYSQFLNRDWLYIPECTEDDLRKFIHKHKEAILKPATGSRGKGIRLITEADLDKEITTGILLEDYVIEQRLLNRDDIACFNPNSLNTIRIVTCIDKNGLPHVISAALRIGNNNSLVDNLCSGGFACSIDINTGIIDSDGYNSSANSVKEHPTTKIIFKGHKILKFDEIKDFVINAANIDKRARYVGWDIAVTPQGLCLIEGNYNSPGGRLMQLEKVGKYNRILELV